MAYRSIFLLKIAYIKNRYGQEATDYFISHPFCENCPEKRLACLTIHHVNGKRYKVYKTLCFNCHIIVHATRSKSETYDDYLKLVQKQNEEKRQRQVRDKKIIKLIKQGLSLREIAPLVNVSHVIVHEVSRKYNVRSRHVNQFVKEGRNW